MPVTMRVRPVIVENDISSLIRKWMNIRDMNGAKNIKLLTFAVVFESLKALSQTIKVIPISNKPT